MMSQTERFRDREDAGKRLALLLNQFTDRADVLVIGLPRGGVPVAYAIATMLNVPLDVMNVRKLGVPGREELAMGAIASGGVRVINDDVVQDLDISPAMLDRVLQRERQELARREQIYRNNRPFPSLEGRTVILTDDGIATGATIHAAIMALRQSHPARIILAIPVAASATIDAMYAEVEEMVCLLMPNSFQSVGMWYEAFPQTSDEEVRALLKRAQESREHPRAQAPGDPVETALEEGFLEDLTPGE